jgi:dTDP-4-dehydrorhamnose reductase
MYHDEVAKILFKLLNKKGIINVGGKAQYIYDFAKKENKKVKKIYQNKNLKIKIPFDSTINIKKLQKLVKIKF